MSPFRSYFRIVAVATGRLECANLRASSLKPAPDVAGGVIAVMIADLADEGLRLLKRIRQFGQPSRALRRANVAWCLSHVAPV